MALEYKIEEVLDKIFETNMTKNFLASGSIFDVGATIQNFANKNRDMSHVVQKMKGSYKSGFWWNEKQFNGVHEFRIIVFRFKNVKYRKSDKYLPVERGERYLYDKIVESNEGINVSSINLLGMGQENHTVDQTDESAKYNYSLYIIGCNAKFPEETRRRIRMGFAHCREVEQL